MGFWWKARRAFFNFGSIGVFQGSLNPLPLVSVIEICVMPVLLYGAESCILTSELLKRLNLSRRSWLGECYDGLGTTQTLLYV